MAVRLKPYAIWRVAIDDPVMEATFGTRFWRSVEKTMNPLHWQREHQIAWIVTSIVGALFGLLLGFIDLPSFSLWEPWQAFTSWLSFPKSYWLWPSLGFLITGLVFYSAQLLRRSN